MKTNDGDLLTPAQAFERWIDPNGGPFEAFEGRWCDAWPVGKSAQWWATTKFRIPPTPLTFVDACEGAAEKAKTLGFPVPIRSKSGHSAGTVSEGGCFRSVNGIDISDLSRTGWTVE